MPAADREPRSSQREAGRTEPWQPPKLRNCRSKSHIFSPNDRLFLRYLTHQIDPLCATPHPLRTELNSPATPVPALTRDLIGKLFGDKGYIGQKLAEDLVRRGLTLFTRVRKNMKALPLSLQDKALLNARNMADIGHIKEFSSLNLSRHRSVINAFVHIIAAITAYQIGVLGSNPRNFQNLYDSIA